MGADNSKGPNRDREQVIKDEAKHALERQKRLYEHQCRALELALEKQQSAYLELKKKEEVKNEVQRLLKERQQDEAKRVADQQIPPIKPTPSAPPAASYFPQHPSPSFHSQASVQQACPTFQFSNLEINPHNQPQPNFQPQPPFSPGPPMFQPQTLTHQYMPAAPKPLLPTPQVGPSNFNPQIPQAAPLNFPSQISNPKPGTMNPQTSHQFQFKKQVSANQARTLSPSPANARSSYLNTQNLARRDTSPHSSKTGQPGAAPGLRESSNNLRNQNPYYGVQNDLKNAMNSADKLKHNKGNSAATVNNNLPNVSHSRNTDVQVQVTSNTTATQQGGKKTTSRPKRRPKNNEDENDDDVTCCTCGNNFGLYIYQCAEGHSSCKDCKLNWFNCGKCSSVIKDLRNFALEAYVSELVRPCPNASEGCNRAHKLKEMDEHLKSCPFNEVLCPLSDIYHQCYWKCKFSEIRAHFTDMHSEYYKDGVGQECTIKDLSLGIHSVIFVTMGPYNFLVHAKVMNEHIYFAVQLLSTQFNALKWTYQFDLYNKSKPSQKYEYTDICRSSNVNIEQIFKDSKCAKIPIGYAETFRNKEGTFNYKFFITKGPYKNGFDNRRGKKPWKGNTIDK